MKAKQTDKFNKLRALYLSNKLFALLLTALFITGCGYSNPYIAAVTAEKPSHKLRLTTWQNRTNELGLESIYFRQLNNWFKRSGMVSVVFENEMADLKLSGEISSIDLPGLFYDSFDEALEIKIKLTVNFTLYNTRNDTILWQEKNYILYEPFLLDPSGEQTEFNKQRALLHIGEELGEIIYLKTHEIISHAS